VINSSITITVSIDKAFISNVIVFNSTSSEAFEEDLSFASSSCKFATIEPLILDLEPFSLDIVDKASKDVDVIVQRPIPPDKGMGLLLILLVDSGLDEDVLEPSFRRNLNDWNVFERTLLSLHIGLMMNYYINNSCN
jgi:hypothetical protein